MNKKWETLYIIGNGFDLDLGLKTTFNDSLVKDEDHIVNYANLGKIKKIKIFGRSLSEIDAPKIIKIIQQLNLSGGCNIYIKNKDNFIDNLKKISLSKFMHIL